MRLEKQKKVYTVFLTSICISTQEKNLVHPSPSPASRRFQSVLTKGLFNFFLIVRKTARGLIIINEKQTAEWKYFLLKTHPKDILKN